MVAANEIISKAELLSPDSSGDAKLKLLRFELDEALSQPFALRIETASDKPALDTAAAIGILMPMGVGWLYIAVAKHRVRLVH